MPQQTSTSSRKSSRRSSSKPARFRTIKGEIRILGIDDGPFSRGDATTLLVGAVVRGGSFLDGVLSTRVQVDGSDSTERIIHMVNSTGHRGQLRVLFLNGVTFGGFNVADLPEINKRTGLPVLAVSRKMPDFVRIRKAVRKFRDWKEKLAAMRHAGPMRKYNNIYFQSVGLDAEDAKSILALTITHGNVPEPIRVAHIIAGGVVRGESKGRA